MEKCTRCGAELTPPALAAGRCSQCGTPIPPYVPPAGQPSRPQQFPLPQHGAQPLQPLQPQQLPRFLQPRQGSPAAVPSHFPPTWAAPAAPPGSAPPQPPPQPVWGQPQTPQAAVPPQGPQAPQPPQAPAAAESQQPQQPQQAPQPPQTQPKQEPAPPFKFETLPPLTMPQQALGGSSATQYGEAWPETTGETGAWPGSEPDLHDGHPSGPRRRRRRRRHPVRTSFLLLMLAGVFGLFGWSALPRLPVPSFLRPFGIGIQSAPTSTVLSGTPDATPLATDAPLPSATGTVTPSTTRTVSPSATRTPTPRPTATRTPTPQPPVLTVSSLSICANPTSTFTVSNTGGGTLNWTATGSAKISVTPTLGALNAGQSQPIQVTLQSGSNSGTVTVSAGGSSMMVAINRC